MEMYIWKSADIHIRGTKHTPSYHGIIYALSDGEKRSCCQDLRVEGFTEKEYEMVRLENVGDVLFQALMLDDVKIKDGMMYADFLSVILDNIVDNY